MGGAGFLAVRSGAVRAPRQRLAPHRVPPRAEDLEELVALLELERPEQVTVGVEVLVPDVGLDGLAALVVVPHPIVLPVVLVHRLHELAGAEREHPFAEDHPEVDVSIAVEFLLAERAVVPVHRLVLHAVLASGERHLLPIRIPAGHLPTVDVILAGELIQAVVPIHAFADDLVFLVGVRNEIEPGAVPDVRGTALLEVEVALLLRAEFAFGRHLAEVSHEAGLVLKGEVVGVDRAGVEVHHVGGRFRDRFRIGGRQGARSCGRLQAPFFHIAVDR